jgi:hypothetical protein
MSTVSTGEHSDHMITQSIAIPDQGFDETGFFEEALRI